MSKTRRVNELLLFRNWKRFREYDVQLYSIENTYRAIRYRMRWAPKKIQEVYSGNRQRQASRQARVGFSGNLGLGFRLGFHELPQASTLFAAVDTKASWLPFLSILVLQIVEIPCVRSGSSRRIATVGIVSSRRVIYSERSPLWPARARVLPSVLI